ncbi:hypothetical protein DFH06DRAFT_1299249 [Mycena polygramma]|nr:hypothetical protein DFH06DRAFT_1299249 [Mycena polygramma]
MSTMPSSLEGDRARLSFIDGQLPDIERSLIALRATLKRDRTGVAEIKSEILNLEHSLAWLYLEKALAKERLDSYKYPVLTLPTELVSEIFIHSLPLYPLCPPLLGFNSPTILSHICRQWREIALATPALWRAIRLSDPHIAFEHQWRIADAWLVRSVCCPLSMHVNEEQLFPAILPCRARLEHLKLIITDPVDLSPLHGPMPSLRQLDLSLGWQSVGAFTFDNVPLLRSVTMNYSASRVVGLPWAQLTSLTLDHVDRDQCVRVLQQTSCLVHCKLVLQTLWTSGSGGPDITLPNITLPCLQSLVLYAVKEVYGPTAAFFGTFITPALLSLDIAEAFLGRIPMNTLASFIERSGCQLEEVSIYFLIRTRARLEMDFRAAFPSIPKFTLVS